MAGQRANEMLAKAGMEGYAVWKAVICASKSCGELSHGTASE